MKFKIERNVCFLLFFSIFPLILTSTVSAQTADRTRATAANANLNAQELRGEGVFLQRCSLCHLSKVVKPYKSFGPSLKGVLKDADAEQVAFIRQFISTGVPDKMPGFKAALSTDQFDDLIAYLKTF